MLSGDMDTYVIPDYIMSQLGLSNSEDFSREKEPHGASSELKEATKQEDDLVKIHSQQLVQSH